MSYRESIHTRWDQTCSFLAGNTYTRCVPCTASEDGRPITISQLVASFCDAETGRPKNVQAIAHTPVVRGMRKSAIVPMLAAIVVIEPARNSVPLVIPIARVGYRFELDFSVDQQRSLVVRVRKIVIVLALAHEGKCLTKRIFCLGRAGVLFQDRLEICPRARQPLAPRAEVGGATYQQQPWQIRSFPCAQGHDDNVPLRIEGQGRGRAGRIARPHHTCNAPHVIFP
jgi:hypothetical protein